MDKYCVACGASITGRMDKKFCDHYCRSDFNNTMNKSKNKLMRKINRILRQNKTVLEKFFVRKNLTLTVDMLIVAGFDFSYYTHQLTDEKNNTYIFCYEYGYRVENGKNVCLKKNFGPEEQ